MHQIGERPHLLARQQFLVPAEVLDERRQPPALVGDLPSRRTSPCASTRHHTVDFACTSMPRYHIVSSLRVEHGGRLDRQQLRTRVLRLEAVDRIDTITVPARSGGGVPSTMAHDGRHHGIYLLAGATNSTRVALRVHPEVAAFLTEQQRRSVEALEKLVGRTVAVEAVPNLDREQVEVGLGG